MNDTAAPLRRPSTELTRSTASLLENNRRLKDALRRQSRQARLRQTASRLQPRLAFWRREGVQMAAQLPLIWTFLGIAVVPTLLAILYFSILASSQYVTEARFSVRSAARTAPDALGDLSGLPALAEVQDSLILSSYVESRAMVEALEKEIDLRALYGSDRIDWISRFRSDRPIERLERYWRRHLSTAIESASGIITVRVWAFSPEDSLKIAQAIVTLSEKLANELGERSRLDAIAQSQTELTRAEQRLRRARTALQVLRNAEGVIDPARTAEGINKLIASLQEELTKLDQEIATAKRTLSPTAPQITVLEARRQATREQLTTLNARLTDASSSNPNTVAAVMTRYDEIEIERQIAEKQYATAAANVERARVVAERQRTYLATFVRPVLAQEYDYPYRFWIPLIAGIVAFITWIGAVALLSVLSKSRSHDA